MNYTISPHKRGDTWDGVYLITINVNNTPLYLSGAEVKMEFRQSIDSPVVMTLSTQNSGIEIVNVNSIRIPPRKIEIPHGNYLFDIQVTYPNGSVKTYISGNWEIKPDITE